MFVKIVIQLASAPSLDRSADDVEGVDWRCLQPAHFSQSFSSPSTPDMQLPLVGAPFFPRKYSLGVCLRDVMSISTLPARFACFGIEFLLT